MSNYYIFNYLYHIVKWLLFLLNINFKIKILTLKVNVTVKPMIFFSLNFHFDVKLVSLHYINFAFCVVITKVIPVSSWVFLGILEQRQKKVSFLLFCSYPHAIIDSNNLFFFNQVHSFSHWYGRKQLFSKEI